MVKNILARKTKTCEKASIDSVDLSWIKSGSARVGPQWRSNFYIGIYIEKSLKNCLARKVVARIE